MFSSAPICLQPLGARLPRDPRNGTVRRPPAMQTLLYLGVQSVPPRLQDSQPDLRKRAGNLGYPRPVRADRIANHPNPVEPSATTFRGLLPSTSSRNLPGPTASKLRQLRPSGRHCPLRRGSAPPSRQVSPVALPRPALRSGQHPADPAPLPFPRSNWTPHTPLHTMLLQVNRALPQHPDGHTRPLCSVILKSPRSGDLRARLWPAPAKRRASHLPCSPVLPKRLQFSAQAHAALPLRRRPQPRLAAGTLRRRSIGTLLQRTGKLAQSWALRVQCRQAPFSSEARRFGCIVTSLGSCCRSVALRLRTL